MKGFNVNYCTRIFVIVALLNSQQICTRTKWDIALEYESPELLQEAIAERIQHEEKIDVTATLNMLATRLEHAQRTSRYYYLSSAVGTLLGSWLCTKGMANLFYRHDASRWHVKLKEYHYAFNQLMGGALLTSTTALADYFNHAGHQRYNKRIIKMTHVLLSCPAADNIDYEQLSNDAYKLMCQAREHKIR